VYEFSRNFRNEGMDRTHNPEFTVLEFYVAYKDYFWMMEFTERLMEKVAMAVHGTTKVQVGNNLIDFTPPFRRISIYDAIKEETGIDVSGMDEQGLREVCAKLGIHTEPSMGKGKLVDELFSEKCEGKFIQPTFIIDYPEEMSPLTKKHRSKAGLVERFELMINGKEMANAYTELNDPIDQRARFEEQVKLMERGDNEAMYIDHDFLRALEYGMPPASGIGFGIDRLCMLMTNSSSIQDVLFFPQMRPEGAFLSTTESKTGSEKMRPEKPAETPLEVKETAAALSSNGSPEENKIIELLSRESGAKKTSAEILEALGDTGMSKTKLGKLLDQMVENKKLVRDGKFFSVA
jgi:lysyl-tRNA synthetase, class II